MADRRAVLRLVAQRKTLTVVQTANRRGDGRVAAEAVHLSADFIGTAPINPQRGVDAGFLICSRIPDMRPDRTGDIANQLNWGWEKFLTKIINPLQPATCINI